MDGDIVKLYRLVLEGGVLSPTLASELLKIMENLSPDEVSVITELYERALEAEASFGRASEQYLRRIQEIEGLAMSRVHKESDCILREFERQLKGVL